MEITLEEIQKKFESLPEDLKWAIMDAKVDNNIIDIGQAEKLNVEQMGQLSLETHMVMLGFIHPDKFEESLKGSMMLGDEKTKAIVNAVNEKILKKIRTKMEGDSLKAPKATGIPFMTEQENRNDAKILNSAGIKIVSEPATDLPTEDMSEKKIKEDMEGILNKRLSYPVKIGIVKTEHTIDNITKNPSTTPPTPTIPSSIMGNIKPTSVSENKLSPSYTRGEDPYRIKPE